MSYLFIALAIYGGYRLIKAGYISVTLPAGTTPTTLLNRAEAFLKTIF